MKSKVELQKRWSGILQSALEDLPELYMLYNDPERNRNWDFNPAVYSCYRRISILDYLLNHNTVGFKDNLNKALPFKMELFQKYDEGMPIHPSLVSMTRFEELFDALATGNMSLADEYAHCLGGRSEAEEYDDEFVLSLGYSLKYAVENNLTELKAWLPRLKAFCENPKNEMSEFMGYFLVLEAVMLRNVERANNALNVLLGGHKKKCQSRKGKNYGPFFHDSPHADLFVWGIGLANLCRHYALNVTISDPLIPEDLLIAVNENV